MLSRLFGKGPGPGGAQSPEAGDTRGLEVVEEDPDTAWSKWANAVAEQEEAFAPTERQELTPELGFSDQPTMPLPLVEGSARELAERARRKDAALAVVDLHHQRIASTIRTMWGHKECSEYINQLIMAGGDGMGHSRVGFNQEAVEAMLVLADLHDAEFGPSQENAVQGPFF